MVIRDTTALGALAGIAATIPQLIIDFLFVQFGFSKYYAFQLSAGIFVSERFTDDALGLLLGGMVWMATAMILGIATVYYLKKTGTDFWWLKGIIVSNLLMYTFIFGFLFNIGAGQVVPLDIPTNLTMFITNVIFGITVAYLVLRWGDNSLLYAKK
ncbi:MAG: hypothetical protein CVV03_03110 [Firmicutes bacterium HGW-Firmicutes-8]|nr:MAG: hypothetical protein CVV03_03110 [Firmicutes bacterium HGW-Firmicutes-8]